MATSTPRPLAPAPPRTPRLRPARTYVAGAYAITPETCTSTKTAPAVATTDTTNCDLTASTDFGVNAGTCAVATAGTGTHTCAAVAGTYTVSRSALRTAAR